MSTDDHLESAKTAPVAFAGRFVILTHDHPFVHWDLMLEANGVLRTWRLLAEPQPECIIAAEPLPDHRLHYLDYEGPVSGGRGTVSRWDHGWHETRQAPQQTSAQVQGQRLGAGRIVFTPVDEPQPECIIAAEPLPDHRLHYLDYEGPVSGGRGTVSRWDHGWHETRQAPQQTSAQVQGQRLGAGRIVFTPVDEPQWTFVFHRD
jgi:hypothetical protein